MNASGRVSLPGSLFLFGAYGKTGAMIAKVAVEHGHDVVLSGSDRDRLNRLSTEMSVPAAPVRLDEQAALRKLIRAAACVIHVAGPFATTFRPMLEACSAEAVPYVDLSGQLDVFRSMEDFVVRQQPIIPILSGAGFGVVALGLRSPGATASTFETLAHGGAVVENGQFVAERMGRRSFTGTFAGGREKFISTPLGELWAVRRSTGVSSVIAGVKRPAPERFLLQSGGLQLLARSPKIRNWLVARLSRGATQNGRVFESKVWARAEDREGRTAVAFLTMGEGYQWSAESAVRAAEQVAFDRRPGLWTPGQYLGKGFALRVPPTKLFELSAGASS
jgi:saccharopine dehydrogenase (NAD+, L-lysine-forming)